MAAPRRGAALSLRRAEPTLRGAQAPPGGLGAGRAPAPPGLGSGRRTSRGKKRAGHLGEPHRADAPGVGGPRNSRGFGRRARRGRCRRPSTRSMGRSAPSGGATARVLARLRLAHPGQGRLCLHDGVRCDGINVARYVDLLIGVVPIVNLEWIQKIHRYTIARSYSIEAVTDTILRRMHDYVHYITPQFSHTHVNFQRVPVVDTSDPFIARDVPTLDESLFIIRFRDPKGIDFPYLLTMIHDSFMSRRNCIVVPGGKMEMAIHLDAPAIQALLARHMWQKRSHRWRTWSSDERASRSSGHLPVRVRGRSRSPTRRRRTSAAASARRRRRGRRGRRPARTRRWCAPEPGCPARKRPSGCRPRA